jgi:hypothetical protein
MRRTVRGSNPGEGEIVSTHPNQPWGPPNLLHNGYWISFPGVKRPGRGFDHLLPSSAEVKERVELYLYSRSKPSSCVMFVCVSECVRMCARVCIRTQCYSKVGFLLPAKKCRCIWQCLCDRNDQGLLGQWKMGAI